MACAFRLFWGGVDHGFGNEVVDAFALGKAAASFYTPTVVSVTPVTGAAVDDITSYQDPVTGQDEAHDLIEEPDLTVDNPNDEADVDATHDADDVSQGEVVQLTTVYLPVVNR